MASILSLETATTNCSVAIGIDGDVVALVEANTPNYSHGEQLHVFISEAVKKAGLSLAALDAIAVSKGPGSYTGLRIGVAAAKGLCFTLEAPLIAVPTLESMAHQLSLSSGELALPLLDARRMEVYSAVYNHRFEAIRETRAEIIDENAFYAFRKAKQIHLIGSGAAKCQEVLPEGNFSFYTAAVPSAKEMVLLAQARYDQGTFEDVAYFEPYYLKDFILQGKKT
ncbi:MAG: tRNA (adenosine(37)-N6)-threonylcarbamoyltransferase complex dimerization subunit type 1 TsaB [Bacteroidota bacterium]